MMLHVYNCIPFYDPEALQLLQQQQHGAALLESNDHRGHSRTSMLFPTKEDKKGEPCDYILITWNYILRKC